MAPGAPLGGQIYGQVVGLGVSNAMAPGAPLGGQIYGQVVGLGVTQCHQGRLWVVKKYGYGLRAYGVTGYGVGLGVSNAMAPGAPLGVQVYGQGVGLGVTQWHQVRLWVVEFTATGRAWV